MAVKSSIFRTVPLMRDERVPFALKGLTAALAILIVSPIDIFGDIPVLGLLDDAALLSLVCYWFVRLAARHVYEPAFAGSHIINNASAKTRGASFE